MYYSLNMGYCIDKRFYEGMLNDTGFWKLEDCFILKVVYSVNIEQFCLLCIFIFVRENDVKYGQISLIWLTQGGNSEYDTAIIWYVLKIKNVGNKKLI